MSEAIIVAIIAGVFSVIAQFVISARSRSELYAKLDKQSEIADTRIEARIEQYAAVTDEKLSELTREVREHNNFVHRVPLLEEQMKVVNSKIKDLENKTGV